ncbi:hypothetical protein P153DRAFT_294023 [Dothidotthia symphoricarpi CBS 119687]|uniref:DUF7357 domain-containing protein n=1 Tax=Dothidotthia symphoricarpi CBS 119687 TaxID=1392245 RepID=A0A6A6AAC7_9PLEO|nr:uncharacterized protein P153DRAFT_294023 [Dothidotthia symphoricarpi CBS 119687]KAF2128044.1 hypothetical protein P153DRAFT_294023 [Dothidotthia symphoricarpi CBS 119687]
MRLRLTVQRNGLPAANILWNVPETNSPQAYTITRLLEDVNHIIPLEAEHWGLEHYVVELDGFECLHFFPVAQALKEDDHINIRPLMTAEVRARTLTGRDQVSNAGLHLVDGVPFGRPYLRQPNRPAVRIPPRKRQRLDDAEVDEGVAVAGLPTVGGEADVAQEETSAVMDGDASPRSETRRQSHRAPKSVQFKQPEAGEDEDSEDGDEDFAPGGESGDDVSMDDEDDSNSDSDSDSNDSSSASGSSSSDSDSDGSSSDSDSDSGESSAPDVLSSRDGITKITPKAQPSSPHIPPGHGKSKTHSRNARRTRTNRLRHLKDTGVLSQDASLDDLQRYEEGKGQQPQEHGRAAKPFSTSSGKRKRLDDEEEVQVLAQNAAELEQRKQELMARLGDQTSHNTAQTVEPVPTPVKEVVAPSPSTPNEQQTPRLKISERLRPNVSAISRILARQAPALKKAPKTKPVVEEPPEPEGASDPDFWKSRISMSAFECWEEDFDLTAPPFPFKQHWDPASKLMRDKAGKKRQKNGGKKPPRPVQEEEEEDEEEKIILNYDDDPTTKSPDAEISAAIEDQLRQDVAIATQSDFPPLPEDMNALPALTFADIKERAIIVCKFFAVNPITVTPEISDYKTAVVETEGDSGSGAGTIRLRIAARDLPKREKRFDSKGNRIYDAADGFFMEDEDEDEGLWEGMFGELLDAKLLKAA